LLSDFGHLILYLGLYIDTDLFLTVSEPSGFPVSLDILRVVLPIALQVMGMMGEPFFHAGVVVPVVVRIIPSPAGIVFGLACFFTGGLSASFLACADSGVGVEGSLAVWT
jgi:hypothetical protein